jgi:hypothetical protein
MVVQPMKSWLLRGLLRRPLRGLLRGMLRGLLRRLLRGMHKPTISARWW